VIPVCVGERVDWIALGFRVNLDDHIMKRIDAHTRIADEHGHAEIVLERDSEVWAARLKSKSKSARILTSTDGDVRVVVDPRAPAGVDENGEPFTEEDGSLPRWTVGIEVSGETLIRQGWRAPLVEAHRIARIFGLVYGARLRRLDLCADFVGFALAREDADKIVSLARHKKLYYSRTRPRGLADGAEFQGGLVLRTLMVAPGADLSARIYDKSFELACKREKRKSRAEIEKWSETAVALAPHKQASVLRAGPRVVRVEFQVRGQALKQMGLRNAEPAHVADALDRIWRYSTTEMMRTRNGVMRSRPGWMRLVVGEVGKRERRALDPRWAVVQRVRFVKEGAPLARVRRSTGASAAQVIGCAVSLLAKADELPRVPVIMADGTYAADVLEMVARLAGMDDDEAKKTLELAVGAILRRAGRVIAEDLMEMRKPRAALEHLFVGWGATLVKVKPHAKRARASGAA
jgi:hypothetical protein